MTDNTTRTVFVSGICATPDGSMHQTSGTLDFTGPLGKARVAWIAREFSRLSGGRFTPLVITLLENE